MAMFNNFMCINLKLLRVFFSFKPKMGCHIQWVALSINGYFKSWFSLNVLDNKAINEREARIKV